MNDVAPMRRLSPATQPISPAKFAHFVLRTGQFETMANPANCDIVSLEPRESLEEPLFSSGRWGVVGIRLRVADEGLQPHR